MGDKDSKTPAADPAGGGRRQEVRRQAEASFDGSNRRKGERRAGADRRASPRNDATD